jgi:hypothetical protein
MDASRDRSALIDTSPCESAVIRRRPAGTPGGRIRPPAELDMAMPEAWAWLPDARSGM